MTDYYHALLEYRAARALHGGSRRFVLVVSEEQPGQWLAVPCPTDGRLDLPLQRVTARATTPLLARDAAIRSINALYEAAFLPLDPRWVPLRDEHGDVVV